MGFFSDNFTFQPGLFHGTKSTDPTDPAGQEDSLFEETPTPLGQDIDMPFRPGTEEALRPEYYETARKMHRAAHSSMEPQYVEESTSVFPSTSFSEPVSPVVDNVMDEPMNVSRGVSRGKTLGSVTDISGLGGRFNNNPRPFTNNTRKDYFWGVMGDEYLAQMRNEFDDIW